MQKEIEVIRLIARIIAFIGFSFRVLLVQTTGKAKDKKGDFTKKRKSEIGDRFQRRKGRKES